MSRRVTYCCSPSIVWVKDAGQTLVVDRETRQTWTLRGMEAVVWDLLAVGYSYQRIVPLLSLIFSLSAGEAKSTLTGLLREWQDTGIVQVCREANDG
ncbi:MAG: hypothetical protein KKC18_04485 [Chloroflexi bacterium]|nr:hypothetical protein [Chloroflexota bacterium]